MLIKVFGAAVQGIEATLITIEVNSSRGCMFYMVGLPDSAVKESHQRILSALQVTGYKMPTSNIVINMAPADIRKEGSSYDLPLAIGMLAAGETISCQKLSRYIMMGELSLDGTIQPIKGALPIAIKAREEGFDGLIVPSQNARVLTMVGVSSRLPLMNSITSCILFTPYTDRLLTTAASRAFCEGTINPSNPSSRANKSIRSGCTRH